MSILALSWVSVAALLLAIAVIIALLLARRPRPGAPAGACTTSAEHAELVRSRQARLAEERLRILQMVEAGRISFEEGDRLLATLERETALRDCPLCGGAIHVSAVKCKHCQRFLVAPSARPRLTRSADRMLAGVCGGVAAYFSADPSLVRILAVLLVLVTGVVPGAIAYLVMALILPPAE